MNKRLNSVLFILGATIANIVVMSVLFLTFFLFFARFLAPAFPVWANQVTLLAIFIGTVLLTYYLYHRFMRWLSGKYPLEHYFGPLFKNRWKR